MNGRVSCWHMKFQRLLLAFFAHNMHELACTALGVGIACFLYLITGC